MIKANRIKQRIREAVLEADHIVIAGHVDPDPDCVGSMLALHWLFKKMGKTSVPLSADPMLPEWDFFPLIEDVRLSRDFDQTAHPCPLVIVIDCEPDRTGDIVADIASRSDRLINIDHHVTNKSDAYVSWVDPTAAAVGELIYELIQDFGMPLDQDVATLLYTAIMADTGSFRYSNTTERSLLVAADLVRSGASPSAIYTNLYERRSEGDIRLLGLVLNSLKRSSDGKVAWIVLTRKMQEQVGEDVVVTGLVQYPRSIAGVDVAIFLHELPGDEVKVSLRSKGLVDVSALAERFGGGGHKRAAGFTVKQPLQSIQEELVDAAVSLTQEAGSGGV